MNIDQTLQQKRYHLSRLALSLGYTYNNSQYTKHDIKIFKHFSERRDTLQLYHSAQYNVLRWLYNSNKYFRMITEPWSWARKPKVPKVLSLHAVPLEPLPEPPVTKWQRLLQHRQKQDL